MEYKKGDKVIYIGRYQGELYGKIGYIVGLDDNHFIGEEIGYRATFPITGNHGVLESSLLPYSKENMLMLELDGSYEV